MTGRISRVGLAVVAVLAGLVYALAMYFSTAKIAPQAGMAVFAFLVGGPTASCLLASLILGRRRDLSVGQHLLLGVWVVTAMLVAAGVVLREGSICLAMAAPLFYGAGLAGSGIAAIFVHRRSPKATLGCAVALVLPFVALPLETSTTYPERNGSIVTVIEIDAPPETVWANTAELRHIRPSEHSRDFSHSVLGVPQPLDARLEGSGVGAVRHIRWQKSMHFTEVVTDWRPGERLGWRFEFQPDSIPTALDRRINVNSDYLKLTDGEYRFEALPGGRTRLTLETRYWLKTPINGYCDLWAAIFLNDMHRAALRVIRLRSEASRLAPSVATS